jgi:DNA-binding transcriptional LysR family regulator
VIVRNFEYLLALNQERHFARAAAACSVSQPTLSAGIKQLEEDMDAQIVKRGHRFEGFTPEGERVLAWAQQMMDDCLRLKQELHTFKRQAMQGPFRIGVLPATMALASVMSVPFAEQAPDLQLSIETLDSAELLHKLRQRELDLAITHLDDSAGDGLTTHALYNERLYFFTSDESPEARPTWDEVAAHPLCLLRFTLPPAIERRLQDASHVLFTDSTAVLAAHVASGRKSTVLPQSLAMYLQPAPGLRAIALGTQQEQASVGFISPRLDPPPAAVQAWTELAHTPQMVDAIRRMLKSHEAYRPRTKASKQ